MLGWLYGSGRCGLRTTQKKTLYETENTIFKWPRGIYPNSNICQILRQCLVYGKFERKCKEKKLGGKVKEKKKWRTILKKKN